jgi:uncharacterized protein YbjT (DUF2867 family)
MSTKKIITVFGATGAQGGGLCRAILSDPNSEFAVRAVTRDATSDKAQALAAMGAEVVAADVDDAASVQKTMEGAYGAFCVTFFWHHFSADHEMQQAKNMADGAKAAGLKHVIWSTLEDTRQWIPLSDNRMPTLQEKYKVPHFDAKAEANHFFTDAGVPVTFLHASFYWENLIFFGAGPKRGPDGVLYLTFPMGDKKLSGVASEDIGKCAYGIFKKGTELVGQTIGVAGDEPTCAEMAVSLTRALGEEVKYNAVPPDVYRGFGFPGADEMGNMFQFYADFEDVCVSTRNVQRCQELNPELQDFDTWLAANASRLPLD